MKKYIAALLALLMLLSVTACGKADENVGKYICVGEAYGTNPYSPPFGESWIDLQNGGKGIYYSSFEFDITWKVEGEAFEATVTFMEMEDSMSGTIKDGVIEVTYGDKRIRFVKEGVDAPADGDAAPVDGDVAPADGDAAPVDGGEAIVFDGIAGYYPVSSAVIDGMDWTISDLRVYDMTEGVFLQFNTDGTGALCTEAGETADSITYDEAAGTLIGSDGTTIPFTVDGDTISIEYYNEDSNSDVTMRFTRDPNVAPVAGDGAPAAPVSGNEGDAGDAAGTPVQGSFDFDNAAVAGSMGDAFLGYSAAGGSSFVSPTTSLKIGSEWFGVMEFSNFVGASAEDYSENVVAKIAQTSKGRAYFEIYPGLEIDTDSTEVSLYINLYDDYFTADIGDEDAWIFKRYLVEDDAQYFSPSLVNGALEIWYEYVHPTDNYSCTVHFFLREDGAPWDEANDPLPPSYEDYKAGLDS